MAKAFSSVPQAPFVRLDFRDRSLLYRSATEIVETREAEGVRACLDRLRGRQAAGFLSYEASHGLEPKLVSIARAARPSDPPLVWFGLFETVEPAPPLPPAQGAWAGQPKPAISFEHYRDAVEQIRGLIAEGDVYQVNFTFPCSVATAGSPLALYAQLRTRAQASWSALVFTGTHWLLSLSPELFFTLEDRKVTCRPMKGTAPPGSDPQSLRDDPKNRAENLMIVDLIRNDLSRVSEPGTVKVEELFQVEEYPTLFQMTSTVTAQLQPGLDAIDVLEAAFPCGSVTGAPKIRAMERIDALEKVAPRGPYTGSIGHIAATGEAEFNVVIRTLVLDAQATTGRLNVGSGIVFDSDAGSEWEECLQKAAFVQSPAEFALFETFAWGPDGNPLVGRHLDRLQRSAHIFEFDFDRTAIESELNAIRSRLSANIRLKITLEKSGQIQCESSSMPDPIEEPVKVAIVERTLPADDFRLAHKTTDRGFYDEARARAGTFEVLFVDQEGFLTEGSFTNLFVPRGEQLLTPPLRRGLLPGILREHLLESGRAAEADLRPADLEDGFFIGNSLRELIPAVIETSPPLVIGRENFVTGGIMTAKRKLGPFEVEPIGLGCMSLSHAYGVPPAKEHAIELLNRALDLGYNLFDTAALYGFGANEELIGEAVAHRRSEFVLASKCGMTGVDGKRVIDGRPETLRRTLEDALRRLRTDVIDLYYLHRWDKAVPIEESIGAMAKFVEEGKVRALGLSEVSATTLRKAHAVHPIAAVQNEYSLWSRNVELGVLQATKELGAALVCFSPVGRGFLAGSVPNHDSLAPADIRRGMPRFQPENLGRNLNLYEELAKMAAKLGCTPAQLSLAWVLSRGDHVIAIPGTTSIAHLEENFAARDLEMGTDVLERIDQLFAPGAAAGPRYPAATLAEIDTEEFA
jgi:para-aminobenzoate synthetase/4-amino-4-deoxychorismate lyase